MIMSEFNFNNAYLFNLSTAQLKLELYRFTNKELTGLAKSLVENSEYEVQTIIHSVPTRNKKYVEAVYRAAKKHQNIIDRQMVVDANKREHDKYKEPEKPKEVKIKIGFNDPTIIFGIKQFFKYIFILIKFTFYLAIIVLGLKLSHV